MPDESCHAPAEEPEAAPCVQLMDFCKHYRELRSMGFPGAVVTGALIQHKNDLSAATEACLAVQH